ncbi:nodulin homeobox isoform X5 [Physcomitrium patens]|uniref:Homeobox domain-containing protein n=2 Tax=Physcomitrium patens TaxID=3218 RepID=A0A7I4AW30_PHYPA|nr:nodulin homeobox-like isoform X1 [Physcomitrium patens]|eukprot:XP_024397271.1 nodulin homeobox-like isoform X1 [Physcomitrella patens]
MKTRNVNLSHALVRALTQAGSFREEMAPRSSNVIDEYVAVEELHALSPKDMSSLLQEEESLVLKLSSAKGVILTVDIEKLASCLPLHLMACVASSGIEPRLRYWLRSVRLLHTLSSLAHGYPKLAQVLLQDVKIRMQILDLVTYMLVVLANMEQEGRGGGFIAVLHAASVACSLYLLMAFISHDWLDIAHVLLAHPKVDVFMDAAFDVVKRDIVLLQVKLRSLNTKLSAKKTTFESAERVAQVTALHCEASLQVLQHLCVTPNFRDQVLSHKELCKNGGILKLVLAVLRLQLPPVFSNSKSLRATFSRSKAKALVMMLKFCESEQCSFLDEVAAEPHAMQLAEHVAYEVLLLVKGALLEDPRLIEDEEEEKKNPMGLMHITSLRLADIFSDDSNFRNLVMDQIAPDLASVLAVHPTKFQERWCGGPVARELAVGEQDASLIFDPFEAAGEAMAAAAKVVGACVPIQEEPCNPPDFQIIPLVASAHQTRAALLVKLFANFFCFNAEVCPADEKDRFMHTFLRCLREGPLDLSHPLFFLTFERTAVRICENLHTLYDYVLTLTSDTVVDDDLVLVSDFAEALHLQICPSSGSVADAPLLSFVRDGHEQKLLQWKNEREQSERWKRLDQSRQSGNDEVGATEGALQASNESEKIEVDALSKVEEVPHTSGEATGHNIETTPTATAVMKTEDVKEDSVQRDGTAQSDVIAFQRVSTKLETHKIEIKSATMVVKEEVESRSANVTEREDIGRGEQESGGVTFGGMGTPATRNSRDREPYSSEHGDESQPKKRKRNIMSDKQVSVMEAALQFEPEMQRSPKLIQQWTNHLNSIGPEVAYHQLKNWLNNRKARIARQEREKQRQEEGDALMTRPEKSLPARSVASDDMDSPAETSPRLKYDDIDQGEVIPLKLSLQVSRTPSNAGSEGEPHNSSNSLVRKWKGGDYVSLRSKSGKDMAVGIVLQVEGSWQGHSLEEESLCLVQVSDLKVDRTSKLPFPSSTTGSSFEEAETVLGKTLVTWDVDHMCMVTNMSTPPLVKVVNSTS